jgi:hypothetical protein
MRLPARVLMPGTRAVGMGIFYTLFYVVIVLAPWIGTVRSFGWFNDANCQHRPRINERRQPIVV